MRSRSPDSVHRLHQLMRCSSSASAVDRDRDLSSLRPHLHKPYASREAGIAANRAETNCRSSGLVSPLTGGAVALDLRLANAEHVVVVPSPTNSLRMHRQGNSSANTREKAVTRSSWSCLGKLAGTCRRASPLPTCQTFDHWKGGDARSGTCVAPHRRHKGRAPSSRRARRQFVPAPRARRSQGCPRVRRAHGPEGDSVSIMSRRPRRPMGSPPPMTLRTWSFGHDLVSGLATPARA